MISSSVMRLTVALWTLVAVVTLCTLLSAASHMLTVHEAIQMYLTLGTPLLMLAGFALGVTLSRR